MKEKEVMIILGGGLTKNYELNQFTKQRFDKAIEVLSKKYFDYIICSGNQTYKKSEENKENKHRQELSKEDKQQEKNKEISEAKAGKKYLMNKGINPNKILLEEKSRDTLSNAYFCRKKIIDPLKIKNITIVTTKFHLEKTKWLFKLIFPENQYQLTFLKSPNGNLEPKQLKNKIKREKIILKFYKEKLTKIYNIKPGDMKTIGNYIQNHNPSFTGKKDKEHEELTKEINKIIKK